MPRRKLLGIVGSLLDQRLAGAEAKTAFEADGLPDQPRTVLAERALNGGMDHHLATRAASDLPEAALPLEPSVFTRNLSDPRFTAVGLHSGVPGNSRNGHGCKTVTTGTGGPELEIPRDRAGSFDPALIAKYQRRFPGYDETIIALYAPGMSEREIAGHVREVSRHVVGPEAQPLVTARN